MLMLFIILVFFSGQVVFCSTERNVLLKSLPNDNSWFRRAKGIALTYGKKNEVVGYFWHSKTIYINAEQVYFSISYIPAKAMQIPYKFDNMVTLIKKHGSLTRSLSCIEDKDKIVYVVADSIFQESNTPEILTKERAEELAYTFFKELDKYGLMY